MNIYCVVKNTVTVKAFTHREDALVYFKNLALKYWMDHRALVLDDIPWEEEDIWKDTRVEDFYLDESQVAWAFREDEGKNSYVWTLWYRDFIEKTVSETKIALVKTELLEERLQLQ